MSQPFLNDPFVILGIPENADDAEIRAAYLAAVQACPPERDAERFSAVRGAYERIKTHKARLALELFDTALPTPVDILERAHPSGRPQRPSLASFQALLQSQS